MQEFKLFIHVKNNDGTGYKQAAQVSVDESGKSVCATPAIAMHAAEQLFNGKVEGSFETEYSVVDFTVLKECDKQKKYGFIKEHFEGDDCIFIMLLSTIDADKALEMLTGCYLNTRPEVLYSRIADLELALGRIAAWNDLDSKFAVDYGSNGVRDHYRNIAHSALNKDWSMEAIEQVLEMPSIREECKIKEDGEK